MNIVIRKFYIHRHTFPLSVLNRSRTLNDLVSECPVNLDLLYETVDLDRLLSHVVCSGFYFQLASPSEITKELVTRTEDRLDKRHAERVIATSSQVKWSQWYNDKNDILKTKIEHEYLIQPHVNVLGEFLAAFLQ